MNTDDRETLIRNLWAIAIVVVAVIVVLFVVVLPEMEQAREIRAWCDRVHGPGTSDDLCRLFYDSAFG